MSKFILIESTREIEKKEACLQASSTQLFNSNIDFLMWIFRAPKHTPINPTKSAFTNHEGAAEILSSCLQLRECKDSEITLSLRQHSKCVPWGGFRAEIRGILRIKLRSRFPHITISWHGSIGRKGSNWNRFCSLLFIFDEGIQTLHDLLKNNCLTAHLQLNKD